MKYHIFKYIQSIIFLIILYATLFDNYSSAPLNSRVTYNKFLEDIKQNKCYFPRSVQLPFNSSMATFEYLGVPLSICNTAEAPKPSKEAICNEVFDTLKNITCSDDRDLDLQDINIDFSDNVCEDISSLRIPHDEESLVKHLNDEVVCSMICDQDYKPACQVLLWSYNIEQEIKKYKREIALVNKMLIEQREAKAAKEIQTKQEQNSSLVLESKATTLHDQTINSIKDGGNATTDDLKHDTVQTKENGQNTLLPAAISHAEMKSDNKSENHDISGVDSVKNILPQKESDNFIVEVAADKSKDANLPEQADQNNANNNVTNEQTKQADPTNQVPENLIPDNSIPENPISKNPTAEVSGNLNPIEEENKEKQISKGNNEVVINNPVVNTKADAEKMNDDPKFKIKTVDETRDNGVSNSDANLKEHKEENTESKSALFDPVTTLKTSSVELNSQMGNEIGITKQFSDSESKITGISNDISSNTIQPSLEKMEGENEIPKPANKGQDPYNDMEGENEYNKIDYDGDDGFFDSAKNKNTNGDEITNVRMPESSVHQNEMTNKLKETFGREPDDIDMLPSFPEQEDSHFFFYFLSIIFILMGGYFLFHNKQKILALIVEGRHERRRRSHGLGYKKLETK